LTRNQKFSFAVSRPK